MKSRKLVKILCKLTYYKLLFLAFFIYVQASSSDLYANYTSAYQNEDKLREQQILEDLAKKANQDGLNEKWLTAFFQAQMDASKEMQKRDFAMWQKEEVLELEQAFSLKEDLRSCIDQLNQEMMILLSKFYKNLDI